MANTLDSITSDLPFIIRPEILRKLAKEIQAGADHQFGPGSMSVMAIFRQLTGGFVYGVLLFPLSAGNSVSAQRAMTSATRSSCPAYM